MEEDNLDWPDEHSQEDFDTARMQARRHSSWTHADPYLCGVRYYLELDGNADTPKWGAGYEFEYYGDDGGLELRTLKDV